MPAPSTQLFPEVVDATTIGQRLTSAVFLPIGIEGQGTGGDAVVGTPYVISRTDEAGTKFGPASGFTRLINAILNRGAGPVVAVASSTGTLPTLVQRQAAWAKFEQDQTVRIRLTDSEVQAEHVALADSAENAELVNNKQVALVGMPTTTAKAALVTAAGAIASKRGVLVAPGVYDDTGTLRGGSFAAACVAAELAKNADPTNDLDLWVLPRLTAIEKAADGLSLFQEKVVAGAAVNDFEDLLQGGVSPLMPSFAPGGVQTTHLRTTWTTDTTMDSVMTRVIVDQIFLDIKSYVLTSGFLRLPNSEQTRKRIQSGVEALLQARDQWIKRVTQPDGSLGYNVSVTSSADGRQVTVGYEGVVIRNIQTVQVSGNLTITV